MYSQPLMRQCHSHSILVTFIRHPATLSPTNYIYVLLNCWLPGLCSQETFWWLEDCKSRDQGLYPRFPLWLGLGNKSTLVEVREEIVVSVKC